MRETRPPQSPNLYGTFLSVSLLLIVALTIFVMLPEYIKYPNSEADSSAYYDAKKVFDSTERHVYGNDPDDFYDSTYSGACPDLSVMTAKALLDRRLTLREVHDLREEAHRLGREAALVDNKNEALKAAGQALIPNTINCPHGASLFQ